LNQRNAHRDLLLAISVCPLLAVSDTMSSAIGLSMITAVSLLLARALALLTARWLDGDWQVAAILLLVTSVVSALALLLHAQFPQLWQSIGIFPLLLATNAAVILRFTTLAPPARAFALTARLCATISVVLILLGIARELVGRGSVFHDAGNQFGAWASSLQLFRADMGFLLAMLPPGAFISLGLILAFRNWFMAREQRQDR
jgi:electron transport complex protein RnfE